VSPGTPASARPLLRLVDGTLDQPEEWGWFCGHCAAPSPGGEAPAPNARVCRQCGLGLLLEANRNALPAPRDPFLVVDGSLLVHAVSRRAETLLKMREDFAVHRPISDLLSPAAAEPVAGDNLGAAIVAAIEGEEGPGNITVRPWNMFGVRMRARVSRCGPPRAALVVLAEPRVSSVRPLA
jgi:hypothetical protein